MVCTSYVVINNLCFVRSSCLAFITENYAVFSVMATTNITTTIRCRPERWVQLVLPLNSFSRRTSKAKGWLYCHTISLKKISLTKFYKLFLIMIKEKRLLCISQNNIGKKIFSPSSVNFIKKSQNWWLKYAGSEMKNMYIRYKYLI